MTGLFKKLFSGTETDLKQLVGDGAMIIDVRTREEYKTGHIKGSVNMPLQTLPSAAQALDKNKVIITCCASGMRSASAKNILKSQGFLQVYNGGGWASLQSKLN